MTESIIKALVIGLVGILVLITEIYVVDTRQLSLELDKQVEVLEIKITELNEEILELQQDINSLE